MAVRPEPGQYVIFTKQAEKMCIGVDSRNGLVLRTYNKVQTDLIWNVWPIPGSDSFYLQHSHFENCVRFSGGGVQLAIQPLQPLNHQFILHIDATGDNYCVINNHDGSQVFDCKKDGKSDGTPIISYAWNKGDNQVWRFAASLALPRGGLSIPEEVASET